jgi:hypothetical protein
VFIRRIGLVALLALSTCALRASSQSASPVSQNAAASLKPEILTADTPRVTPGGATFTVPSGWSIMSGKNLVLLGPPETDTHIAIFDSEATDAKSAVAAAWVAYKPAAKRPDEAGHATSRARRLG